MPARTRRGPAPRRPAPPARLCLETLESRCLPSANPWPPTTTLAEQEGNDTVDAAQSVGPLGQSLVSGAIATPADVDWYSFSLSSPAEVQLTAWAQDGRPAPVLSLYNSDPGDF